jgi:hypothetical protein
MRLVEDGKVLRTGYRQRGCEARSNYGDATVTLEIGAAGGRAIVRGIM